MTRRNRKSSHHPEVVEEPSAPDSGARALWPRLGLAAILLAALVSLDQFVLHSGILTTFEEYEPVSPLYAFVIPKWETSAFIFVGLAVCVGWFVPRLIALRSGSRFAVVLAILSVALPLALFLVRDEWPKLGSQFLIYPGEEYFEDATRINNLGGFVRHYTEIAPDLSLHGRVHPPGFATILYLVRLGISPTPLVAGLVVLLIFAVGVISAWRAFAQVVDERAARIAALTLLASPSLLDFACTSMDAVFFAAASLVLYGVFVSLSERGTWWLALVTGIAAYAAAFCSFSVAPLGLFVGLYGLVRWRDNPRSFVVPRQLAMVALGFLAAYAGVRLGVGFDLWESLRVAKSLHYDIMGQVIGRTVASAYVPITIGNAAGLLIGSGLAIVALLFWAAPAFWRSKERAVVIATFGAVGVMCAGGLYTMETERIFMFAIPWLAVSAVAVARPLSDTAVLLLLAAGWLQAFGMESLLFTLW